MCRLKNLLCLQLVLFSTSYLLLLAGACYIVGFLKWLDFSSEV
jgi:hypothetical protein